MPDPMPTRTTELTAGRLRLREFTPADVDAYTECLADPVTRQWWTGQDRPAARVARERIDRALRERDTVVEGGRLFLAVEVAGRFAGRVSLRYSDVQAAHPAAELGFETHPRFRGQGVASQASALLCAHGFDRLALGVIRWHAFVGNWASRRVAWRVGFGFDGRQRRALLDGDSFRDAWVATLLPGEPMQPRTRWLDVPRLAGEGLVLRPLRDGDAGRIVEGASDPVTARWLPLLPTPYEPADAHAFLADVREDAAAGTDVTWALADPSDDRLVGCVGLNVRRPEVGYWVHPDARRKGLATEAVRLVLDYAFGPLRLRRVALRAAVPNAGSRRVAVKAGMRQVGVLRGEELLADGPCDVALYEAVADERSAALT